MSGIAALFVDFARRIALDVSIAEDSEDGGSSFTARFLSFGSSFTSRFLFFGSSFTSRFLNIGSMFSGAVCGSFFATTSNSAPSFVSRGAPFDRQVPIRAAALTFHRGKKNSFSQSNGGASESRKMRKIERAKNLKLIYYERAFSNHAHFCGDTFNVPRVGTFNTADAQAFTYATAETTSRAHVATSPSGRHAGPASSQSRRNLTLPFSHDS